jgi:hypothetical protein
MFKGVLVMYVFRERFSDDLEISWDSRLGR